MVKKLKFCPKCGGLMLPKKSDKKGRGVTLECRSCKKKVGTYSRDYNIKEKVEKTPKDEVIVMEKDISLDTLPVTTVQCPQCEHTKAYWWVMQTRSVDEAPTRFYQCCKCGYKWREYQ